MISKFRDTQYKELQKCIARLAKAKSLLLEIRTTGSHYQIIEKINRFFKDEK